MESGLSPQVTCKSARSAVCFVAARGQSNEPFRRQQILGRVWDNDPKAPAHLHKAVHDGTGTVMKLSASKVSEAFGKRA